MSSAARAVEHPRNFTLGPHDLDDGDWVLSEEEAEAFARGVPDYAGEEAVAFFVESDDDAAFDVEVKFLDETGNVKGDVDGAVDSNLSSSSPTGGNHFVFQSVELASRYVDVVITDTSGGQNRVQGTLNFHS